MELSQMIDVIKRCGEEMGTAITEEDMASVLGLSPEAFFAGDEAEQGRLSSMLNVAYKDLFAAVRRASYQSSLLSTIRAVKAISKQLGRAVSEEEMAAKVNLSVEQLNAYVGGAEPVPAAVPQRLHEAYLDLYEALDQHYRAMPLRSTISTIKRMGEKQGLVITEDEMAQRVGISRAAFDAFLQEPRELQEPGELEERLKAVYRELLKNVRVESVSLTARHAVRRPLVFDLPNEEEF
jgi:hypothetical protein